MVNSPPRVLVIDSHPVMRDGVALLLSGALTCEVSVEDGNFAAATGRILEQRIDLVITDFRIHGEVVLTFLESLETPPNDTRCLIFSAFDELQVGYPCMRAGAFGFVSKASPTETLVEAVKTVLNGRHYVSGTLAKTLMGKNQSALKCSVGGLLSFRELEVFSMIADGMVVSQIASRLGISVKTVESHRENIKNKLGCNNATQVVAAAVRWLHETVDDSGAAGVLSGGGGQAE